MGLMDAKATRLAAIAAGLLLCAQVLPAQDKTAAERLAAYEAGISTGSPIAAGAFLKDAEARALAASDAGKAQTLVARANALEDLKELLSMSWDEAGANKLSQSLELRLDVDTALTRLGVGPEPEKLLVWMSRFYPGCSTEKKKAVRKAIRRWDVVFGTATARATVRWNDAGVMVVTKGSWDAMVLRERNGVLAKIMEKKPDFLIYNDERQAADKQEKELQKAIEQARNSGKLTPAQVAELDKLAANPVTQQQSLQDQAYTLGKFFDGGGVSLPADLQARINSARSSKATETLMPEQRKLLGDMMNTSVTRELTGTTAGARALSAFPNGLKITVAPCDGSYSRYDAATGAIVLDSETIQQYMRLKGYTADSVLRDPAQLAGLSKYMSPAVVYESAHKSQSDWARAQNGGAGAYKPRVQEDEIEAMSLEGLYTAEKMRKDQAFTAVFTEARDNASYAEKKMEIGTEYASSGAKKFGDTVRQRYSASLPSLSSASAQALDAIGAELDRRAAMSQADRAAADSAAAFTLSDAMAMSPAELADSVGDLPTAALQKLRNDMSDLGAYERRYTASENSCRDALKVLNSGASARRGVAPVI